MIVVLNLLCKREWSDLDAGLVLSGQKTLQSLSCICLFLLSDFVEFVSFIQCDSSSRVRFHITLASHWDQFTESLSKNEPRFKLDRLTGAPRIGNQASSISNYLAAGYVCHSVT